jgi:hypothetical protein
MSDEEMKTEETKTEEIEIVQHGRRWVNHRKDVVCPECGACGDRVKTGIKFDTDLSTAKDPKIGHATKKYTAELFCDACKCAFRIQRTEL